MKLTECIHYTISQEKKVIQPIYQTFRCPNCDGKNKDCEMYFDWKNLDLTKEEIEKTSQNL